MILSVSSGPDSGVYRLWASTSDFLGNHLAPTALEFNWWRWLSPCLSFSTIRSGILCFLLSNEVAVASDIGFLVVWSIELPVVPRWRSLASRKPEYATAKIWWDDGTPLLRIIPCRNVQCDLSPEALKTQGLAKGWFLSYLQERFSTIDDLFEEVQDYKHDSTPDRDCSPSESESARMTPVERAVAESKAAAKIWRETMAPEQQMTLGNVLVSASIKTLKFLDRTSFSLEIKTADGIM